MRSGGVCLKAGAEATQQSCGGVSPGPLGTLQKFRDGERTVYEGLIGKIDWDERKKIEARGGTGSERGEIQRSETQGGGTGTEGESNVPRPDRDNHSWAIETSGLTGLAGFQVGKKAAAVLGIRRTSRGTDSAACLAD